MLEKLKELSAELDQLNSAAKKIIDNADSERGEDGKQAQMTTEEQGKVDEIYDEYDNVKAEHDGIETGIKSRSRFA